MRNSIQNIFNIKTVGALAIVFIALFVRAPHAEAARLYLDIPERVYGTGDTFRIPVKLDTEGESINALSADILFPDDILSVAEVRDNDSPISNWIDAPTVSGNSISFSGIIPGGFEGMVEAGSIGRTPGTVLWLVVKGEATGTDSFTFASAHAYRNDGSGTEALVTTEPASITIEGKGSGAMLSDSDTTPPEAFIPVVTTSPFLFDGKYTVIFNTTDKGSGVAYYEVSEGGGGWNRATSPYLLSHQSLRSVVRVRAVDHSGNIRTEVVGTPVIVPTYVFALLALSVLVLFYVLYSRYNKKRHKRA